MLMQQATNASLKFENQGDAFGTVKYEVMNSTVFNQTAAAVSLGWTDGNLLSRNMASEVDTPDLLSLFNTPLQNQMRLYPCSNCNNVLGVHDLDHCPFTSFMSMSNLEGDNVQRQVNSTFLNQFVRCNQIYGKTEEVSPGFRSSSQLHPSNVLTGLATIGLQEDFTVPERPLNAPPALWTSPFVHNTWSLDHTGGLGLQFHPGQYNAPPYGVDAFADKGPENFFAPRLDSFLKAPTRHISALRHPRELSRRLDTKKRKCKQQPSLVHDPTVLRREDEVGFGNTKVPISMAPAGAPSPRVPISMIPTAKAPSPDASRFRAARGYATHPRSIAERVRRSRIAERLDSLRIHLPRHMKNLNTVDMLDEMCNYVKWLHEALPKYDGLDDPDPVETFKQLSRS